MNLGSDAPAAKVARYELRVRGVVQGVGFRPYVYHLARRHGLAGFVLNGARGVVIEIEGDPAATGAYAVPVIKELQTVAGCWFDDTLIASILLAVGEEAEK